MEHWKIAFAEYVKKEYKYNPIDINHIFNWESAKAFKAGYDACESKWDDYMEDMRREHDE